MYRLIFVMISFERVISVGDFPEHTILDYFSRRNYKYHQRRITLNAFLVSKLSFSRIQHRLHIYRRFIIKIIYTVDKYISRR